MLLTLLLLAAAPCQSHQVPDQHLDAASVRRVDSAWSVAYVHADTAFLRCLFTTDYVGYSKTGVISDREAEVAKSLRSGDPKKPLPDFPASAHATVHGTSAVVTGVFGSMRWNDVYVFQDGAWHAFASFDQQLPGGK